MKRALCLVVSAILSCSAAWSGQASPAGSKLSKELLAVDPAANVDVIIQYKVQPTNKDFDRVHALGGSDKKRFNRIPGAAFTVPASALQDLSKYPDVTYISLDRKVQSHLDLSAGAVNAAVAWSSNYTGTGIGVAVIDSGINSHIQDLGNESGQTGPGHTRVVYAENFLVPATNPDGSRNNARYRTNDGYGHGTHVAGIIAGNGFLSSGPGTITTYKGIAPTANLIDLQVLDATGEGQDSTVIAAIEQAIALKDKYNIRVINMSLGRSVYESFAQDPLCQAAEQAWQAGIAVVVAAGNDGRDNSFGNNGYGTIDAPGNDPYVITVGAMNAKFTPFAGDDVITTYTSRGPSMIDHIVKPDVVAPGNHISSLLDNNAYLPKTYPQDVVNPLAYQTQGGGQSYLVLNGTSMATGVVSGAVADLLSANPELAPDQVKAILMLSASKQFRTYSDSYYNLAALSYAQNVQLQQAEQQLQAAIGQAKSAAKQATNAQHQAAQAAAQAQAAVNAYNSATQEAAAAAAQVQTAQANVNAATLAYNSAAKQATNSAAAQSAQNTLNQAQGSLAQAQNNLAQANKQLQKASNAMAQANNASATAAQRAAAAETAAQTAAQEVSSLQSRVASLQIPNTNMQLQLQQMQSDPSQYTSTQYDIFTVGAGYLDLSAALSNISNAPSAGLALSPVAYIDPTSGQVDVSGNYAGLCGANTAFGSSSSSPLAGTALCTSSVAGLSAIWQFDSNTQTLSSNSTVSGSRCLWGTESVWGAGIFTTSSSTVSGSRCLWGTSSIWSASSTQAFRCLWGTDSLWGADSSSAASTDSASSVLAGGDPN